MEKDEEEGIPEGIGKAAGCLLILLLFPWLLIVYQVCRLGWLVIPLTNK